MSAYEHEARAAYKAYGQTIGDPVPEWEALPENIQRAWCNAAKAVYERAMTKAHWGGGW